MPENRWENKMEQISHGGRIVRIDGSRIEVEITSRAACQSCSVRHSCSLADSLPKTIEVFAADSENYALNEEVEVGIAAQNGLKAVFYGYILPLLLVIASLIGAVSCGYSEEISGIFSIIVLIPYYFWLFLIQKKLRRQFRFTISKK